MGPLYLPRLDIWSSIFDFSSPVDLIHFGQASRSARSAVAGYNRTAHDLNRLLEPYFSSPDEIRAFREIQHFTGTIISGSTALQFFNRTTYPNSDLDLYVDRRFCPDIAWWLMNRGYKFKSDRPTQPGTFKEAFARSDLEVLQEPDGEEGQADYVNSGVHKVYDFVKKESGRKIQLISARRSTLEVVLKFHSTCVMNVITHAMAYSLYPHATFQQRRSLVCGKEGGKRQIALAKYKARGWTIERQIAIEEQGDRKSDFSHGRRWVGDGHCWKVPLRPCFAENPEVGRDWITSNSWTIYHPVRENARMMFCCFDSNLVRFNYLLVDRDVLRLARIFTIQRRKTDNLDDDLNVFLMGEESGH